MAFPPRSLIVKLVAELHLEYFAELHVEYFIEFYSMN